MRVPLSWLRELVEFVFQKIPDLRSTDGLVGQVRILAGHGIDVGTVG